MNDLNHNTGVLDTLPSPSDYIAGGVSGIEYKVLLQSGDWSSYLPSNEAQVGIAIDTYACVTFSALNCLETQLQRQYEGKFNFSDRFTAKMSGTTKQGNYLNKVAESIRNDGLVPESDWSWDPRGRDPQFDWETFYSDIPQTIVENGLNNLKRWDIRYEWVDTSLESLKLHLKQAPLQIVTKVCGGWNSGDTVPVKGCGISTQHATMLYKIDEQGYHIFDHYDPFPKILAPDYGIAYAMKYTINLKTSMPMLDKGKGGLVRVPTLGAYGLNLGHEILDADSKDRTALLALDIHMRRGNGVILSQEEWDSVPHRPF